MATDHDPTTDALPRVVPPGQRVSSRLQMHHYGRVPSRSPSAWTLEVAGATADGHSHEFTLDEVTSMPRETVEADFHCVTHWSTLDQRWEGVLTRTLLDRVPPAPAVTHVAAIAEFGYSATLRLVDLMSPRALLAWRLDGADLPREHGWPLRLVVPHLYAYKSVKWLRGLEYLTEPTRGFWESRGYHVVGDAWREERYAHQE